MGEEVRDLSRLSEALPQLIAELRQATERAARAETKVELLMEQIVLLKAEMADLKAHAEEEGRAQGSSFEPSQGGGASPRSVVVEAPPPDLWTAGSQADPSSEGLSADRSTEQRRGLVFRRRRSSSSRKP